MMPGKWLLYGLAGFCWVGLLAGCQLLDPPPADTVLRLSLNDSLKQYENVNIAILDANDSNKVLEHVWSGPIPDPAKLPDYKLAPATGKDFVVRVQGYKDGDQLFLQTLIIYKGGKKTVEHNAVPAYKPRNQLISLSEAKWPLSPAFNRDTLLYTMTTPIGISSVNLSMTPVFAGARITTFLRSDTLTDLTSKPIPVGSERDTIVISVTDSSQGVAYTLAYRIILIPTLPSGGKLKNLVCSSGTLNPAFNPDTENYTLEIANNVPSVTCTLYSQDPSTMYMVIGGGGPIFDGKPSPAILVNAGGKTDVEFWVFQKDGPAKSYGIVISRL